MKTMKSKARRLDAAGLVEVRVNLPKEMVAAFAVVYQQDGLANINCGIRFLIRWAIEQNSLCPMHSPERAAIAVLEHAARQLATEYHNMCHLYAARNINSNIEDELATKPYVRN